jgi:bifunctional pyridoxal-dependent enzyme with beta-cystathionase and maltose regulon repressor activities
MIRAVWKIEFINDIVTLCRQHGLVLVVDKIEHNFQIRELTEDLLDDITDAILDNEED